MDKPTPPEKDGASQAHEAFLDSVEEGILGRHVVRQYPNGTVIVLPAWLAERAKLEAERAAFDAAYAALTMAELNDAYGGNEGWWAWCARAAVSTKPAGQPAGQPAEPTEHEAWKKPVWAAISRWYWAVDRRGDDAPEEGERVNEAIRTAMRQPAEPVGASQPEPTPYIDGGMEAMVWRACVHASLGWEARDRVVERFRALYAKASAAPLSPEPVGAEPAERAWLIERKVHGYGPQWWGFNYEPGKHSDWCAEANKAIRFSRKEDAERMRLHVIAVRDLTGQHGYERSITVTEHEWFGGAPQAPAPAAPSAEARDALVALLDRYTSLVNCGDCGHWNVEAEPCVIAARAAIAAPAKESKT